MDYPLKVRLYLADYSKEVPESKDETYEVRARYSKKRGFIVIGPINEKEIKVYDSIEDGVGLHDTDRFYWVGEVLEGTDPRIDL